MDQAISVENKMVICFFFFFPSVRDRAKGVSKMKMWQGYAHAGVVTISAWLCRETIFEGLQWLQGRPPSDSLLLGSYILLTGIACLPIVALHFSHSQVDLFLSSFFIFCFFNHEPCDLCMFTKPERMKYAPILDENLKPE
jgi:hypothetical protein